MDQSKQIKNVIKWNKDQIAKSKNDKDIARYQENIRKLEKLLNDDAA